MPSFKSIRCVLQP